MTFPTQKTFQTPSRFELELIPHTIPSEQLVNGLGFFAALYFLLLAAQTL